MKHKKNNDFVHIRQFIGLHDDAFVGADVDMTPLKIHMTPEYFPAAADLIRGGSLMLDPDDLSLLDKNSVPSWLDTMVAHSKGGMESLMRFSKSKDVRRGYDLESLILMVRGAGLLRQDAKLKEMLRIAGQLFGLPTQS